MTIKYALLIVRCLCLASTVLVASLGGVGTATAAGVTVITRG